MLESPLRAGGQSEPVWPDTFIAPDKMVLPRAESQMKFAMLDPSPGPSVESSPCSISIPTCERVSPKAGPAELNALQSRPGCSRSRSIGGKMLQYSGWADQQVNPFPGIEYYETVSKRLGAEGTRDFYRLFMVPGMFHCNGGPGCNTAGLAGRGDGLGGEG